MIGIVGFNLFPQRNNVNWVLLQSFLRNKQRPECMKKYYEGHEDWYENVTEAEHGDLLGGTIHAHHAKVLKYPLNGIFTFLQLFM